MTDFPPPVAGDVNSVLNAEKLSDLLSGLQQRFCPELMRNVQLFTDLFEALARPALVRVRPTTASPLRLDCLIIYLNQGVLSRCLQRLLF